MRPLILLSNDDGIDAPGLAALADGLGELADLLVVARERERSAVSHSLTLHKPLRAKERRPGWFAVNGSPVDCVYLGVLHLARRRPDLVVSGINHGYNLGSDVFYSGTVAAAVEGALRGVPAVALSRDRADGADDGGRARFGAALCRALLEHRLPPRTLLNVNFPASEAQSYRWTRLGERLYRDLVDERRDPRGRAYYWIAGGEIGMGDVAGSDCLAVRDGLISITPLMLDLTAHELLEPAPAWPIEGFERAP